MKVLTMKLSKLMSATYFDMFQKKWIDKWTNG